MKDTIFSSKITLNCQGNLHEFDNPIIMGIINTTPDSFFEGSRLNSIDSISAQTQRFINEGVNIIDIGGYSSRPGADDVSEKDELDRILPAIKKIREKFPEILISIDTFRTNIAQSALKAGANIINDISGGQNNASIYKTAANFLAPYIMMHMRGTPQNMQKDTTYKNLLKELILFFSNQIKIAQKNGVKDIIIDPGLGFSKTLNQNYEIISKISLLNVLEKPVLIGLSRKSMLYNLLGNTANECLNATTITNTLAVINGANILRVHDVKEAVEIQKIIGKIKEINLQ